MLFSDADCHRVGTTHLAAYRNFLHNLGECLAAFCVDISFFAFDLRPLECPANVRPPSLNWNSQSAVSSAFRLSCIDRSSEIREKTTIGMVLKRRHISQTVTAFSRTVRCSRTEAEHACQPWSQCLGDAAREQSTLKMRGRGVRTGSRQPHARRSHHRPTRPGSFLDASDQA
jgi:hypothetical protein